MGLKNFPKNNNVLLLAAILLLLPLSVLFISTPGRVHAESISVKNDSPGKSFPVVNIKTSLGDITVELYPGRAPASVDNFLVLVDQGFYTGIIFHRIVPGFVIQAGGFTSKRKKRRVSESVRNESIGGLSNKEGTLAMARTDHPDSANSQFYINLKDNYDLDARGTKHGYTVFGKVIQGMDVVENIAAVKTANLGGSFTQTPLQTIVILSAKRASPTASSAN